MDLGTPEELTYLEHRPTNGSGMFRPCSFTNRYVFRVHVSLQSTGVLLPLLFLLAHPFRSPQTGQPAGREHPGLRGRATHDQGPHPEPVVRPAGWAFGQPIGPLWEFDHTQTRLMGLA